jgi:restriction endonuclease
MERSSKSYAALIENFCPQLVLRYGATFPEFIFGRGKNKIIAKDYQELVYELDAAASFNNGLIKGVAKEHLELPGRRRAEKKIKIVSTISGDSVNMKYTNANHDTTYTLHIGESLYEIDADLDGVVVCTDGLINPYQSMGNFRDKFIKPICLKIQDGKQTEIDDFIVSVGEKIGIGDDVSFGVAMKSGISLRSYKR